MNDNFKVADEFATYFESVYSDSSTVVSAVDEFRSLCAQSVNPDPDKPTCSPQQITVQLIDRCIRKLKLGKANGPDGLSAENLVNAHPLLIVNLSLLFRTMACHGYVPHNFGQGTIVPLLKDKLGDVNDVNNYRGITLIPVISKLFELVIIEICEPFLGTDDLQFGFKKGSGCANALFVFSETIKYFRSKGSSVFVASLDFKKAYDRVNHFKLLSSLIKVGVPMWVVMLLYDWYCKLYVNIKWRGSISRRFCVRSGVRQGSSLSPSLFNIFINKFIVQLKDDDIGCKFCGNYIGVIMYADDLLLLSASVSGLQHMLNRCYSICVDSNLEFNCDKSSCAIVGPSANYRVENMSLGNHSLPWATVVKYLGVSFQVGGKLFIDTALIKRKFYASVNCILSKTRCMHEMVKLALMEAHCLPVLLYSCTALSYTKQQLNDLSACWNSVYRRIFGFNKWDSVRVFIAGLGRMNFTSIHAHLCFKFQKVGIRSKNEVFGSIVRHFMFSQDFKLLCSSVNVEPAYNSITKLSFYELRQLMYTNFCNKP